MIYVLEIGTKYTKITVARGVNYHTKIMNYRSDSECVKKDTI